MTEDPFGLHRLSDEWKAFGLTITPVVMERLELFASLLYERNAEIDLTSVPAVEFGLRHVLDSASLFSVMDASLPMRIADVGSGAGLPGIVIKIIKPHLHVTLIESMKKRCDFMRSVIAQMALSDIEVQHARAERIGRDHAYREQFDVVTARAVAPLPELVEYLLPLARVGGRVIAMKGIQTGEELKSSRAILHELGGETPERYPVKVGDRKRELVVIPKRRITPEHFPRPIAKIRRKIAKSKPSALGGLCQE